MAHSAVEGRLGAGKAMRPGLCSSTCWSIVIGLSGIHLPVKAMWERPSQLTCYCFIISVFNLRASLD